MQYNFLGGQSQRDTLAAALGQRNPTLEAQLDFSKNAFVTGVQGVGQTARTAMGLAQQQQESLLRAKTTREESELSRASALDTLTKRMEFDKSQAAEATAQRQAEIQAAIAQRKIERDEAAALRKEEDDAKRAGRNQDLNDARARDREEYDRRVAEAAKTKDLAAKGKLTAALTSFNQELDLDDDHHKFEDWVDEVDSMGVKKRSSKTKSAMIKHRDDMLAAINAATDPNERAALIDSIISDKKLIYGNVRGVVDANWRKKNQAGKSKPAATEDGTDAASVARRLSGGTK